MTVLAVGDIVGSPGRRLFRQVVARLRAANAVQAVVVNAENAAGGNGVTAAVARELFAAGADVLTLGDHTWDQKGTEAAVAAEPRLLRPANFPPACPGRGWATVQTPLGPLTVVNLLGRVFMGPAADCPFRVVDDLLRRLPAGGPVVVDFHAEATSEKIAMGRFLDGRVAAVLGTHTHVQTADERILPGGTAYLTDLGMTGPAESVLGREIAAVLRKFVSGMPARLEVAAGPAVLEGALLRLDRRSGRAVAIERFREFEAGGGPPPPPAAPPA